MYCREAGVPQIVGHLNSMLIALAALAWAPVSHAYLSTSRPHVSAIITRHTTRTAVRGGSMSLPLDSSLIVDTFSPAIERRMQALACAVPVAISVLATRSSSGIPQIAEVMDRRQSKTPSQVATKWGPRVFFGDAVVYMSRMAYHVRRGYPLACWSELIPLMLQNIICFYLTRSRGFDPDEPAGGKLLLADHWLKLVLDATFLAALGLFMVRLPTKLLPLLCLWSVPQHTVKLCLLAGGYAATHRSLGTAPRPREESPRMPKEGCGERRSKMVRRLPQAAVFTVFDQVPVSHPGAPLDLVVHGAGARDGPHGPSQHVALWVGPAHPLVRVAHARGHHSVLSGRRPRGAARSDARLDRETEIGSLRGAWQLCVARRA